MSETLNALYQQAVETHGQEAADRAAEESIEAYNCNALAGKPAEECEAEQAAAFAEALES